MLIIAYNLEDCRVNKANALLLYAYYCVVISARNWATMGVLIEFIQTHCPPMSGGPNCFETARYRRERSMMDAIDPNRSPAGNESRTLDPRVEEWTTIECR